MLHGRRPAPISRRLDSTPSNRACALRETLHMSNKPKVFIGSSSEGLRVADEVADLLRNFADVTVWPDDVFRPSRNYLQTLIDELDHYDFAILVLTGDDQIESRGEAQLSPRDNVLFELGLFMGHLGPERTYFIKEKGEPLKLPSDLAGIKSLEYQNDRKDGSLTRALAPLRPQLAREMERLGPRQAESKPQLAFYSNQGELTDEQWRELLLNTKCVFDVMGTALGGWRRTREFRKLALEKDDAGCAIRILIMNDEHPALDTILYGFEDEQSRQDLVNDIRSNRQFFERLAGDNSQIEVRQIINGNAQFFITRTDAEAVLVQYLYSATWGHGPLWRCSRDSPLYEVAAREFQHLWELNGYS